MGSFDQTRAVEVAGLKDLLPFLRQKAYEGRFVTTDKGTLSEFLQRTVGDALLNTRDGRVWSLEMKTEEDCRYGNLFLETWSNRSFGKQTVGWMLTLRADVLLYHFKAEKTLYCIDFRNLFTWAFEARGAHGNCGRIWDFPERLQSKYSQRNKTYGRCVPISVIEKEVRCNRYCLSEKDGEWHLQAKGQDHSIIPEQGNH